MSNASIHYTNRNTKAVSVSIGDHTFYFSYATCIAYDGPEGRARIANHWGPTTGRHFNDLCCAHFPVVSDEKFEDIINKAMSARKAA